MSANWKPATDMELYRLISELISSGECATVDEAKNRLERELDEAALEYLERQREIEE